MSRKKSLNFDISNPTLLNVQLYRAVTKADNPDEITLVPSVEPSVTLQLPVRILQTDTISTLKEVLEKAKETVDTSTGPLNNETELPSSLTNSTSYSPSSNRPALISHHSSSQPGSPAIGRYPLLATRDAESLVTTQRAESQVTQRAESQVTQRTESQVTQRTESQVTQRAESQVTQRTESQVTQRAESQVTQRAVSQYYDESNMDNIFTNYLNEDDEDDTRPSMTLQRSISAEDLFSIKEKADLETMAQENQTKKAGLLSYQKAVYKKHPPNVARFISTPVLVEKISFTAELSSDGYALVPTQTRQPPNAKPVLKRLSNNMRRSLSLEGNLDASDDKEVCSIPPPPPPVQAANGSDSDHKLVYGSKVPYGRAFSEQNVYKPPHQAIKCDPCDVCDEDIKKVLFNPRSVEALIEVLQLKPALANCYNAHMEAPIHAILRKKKKWRLNLLVTLLSHSLADVNLPTQSTGHTPLHIAMMDEDDMSVKTLLAFGADIYATGLCDCTQLKQRGTNSKLIQLLADVLAARIEIESNQYDMLDKVNETVMEYLQRKGERGLCDEMEEHINRTLSISSSFNGRDVDSTAIALQQREIGKFKSTGGILPYDLKKGGVKILCLDGGGMKGLAQIEVLCQLEVATGQKITELFDWIVGTSTGAIIALALVYANMSLAEIRRLYFNMKEKIFGKGRHNSEALEVILKETFGMRAMEDVKSPKVMIGAVNKDTTNLQLQFFNNCLDDSYSKQPVWKVARYTSAAPMFFTEFENYVDGGVLANNPCEYALTAIQKFYREQKMRPQVSLLVSVGSGVYPALKLGNIDAQKFLYFGIHTFRLDILRDRATNLISLLSNALVESEAVAKNCKSRCEEQGILFYRFSPKLDEVIAAGETDNERLVNMLIKTRLQLKEQGLQDLANLIVRNRDLNKLY